MNSLPPPPPSLITSGLSAELKINKASMDDWPHIYEVLQDAVARQRGGNPLLSWTDETIQRENILRDLPIQCFYIAFHSNTPIAVIAVTDEHKRIYPELEKGKCLYARWLVVKQGYAKTGLSKYLLDIAKKIAAKSGLPLRLETARFNRKLVDFYISHAFEPCGKFYDIDYCTHFQLFIYQEDKNTMTQQFKDIVNSVKPEILENPGVDLVEEDIIDSLDIMNLIAALESAFGIDFDPDDVTPETFANPEAIWAIVDKYCKEQK